MNEATATRENTFAELIRKEGWESEQCKRSIVGNLNMIIKEATKMLDAFTDGNGNPTKSGTRQEAIADEVLGRSMNWLRNPAARISDDLTGLAVSANKRLMLEWLASLA